MSRSSTALKPTYSPRTPRFWETASRTQEKKSLCSWSCMRAFTTLTGTRTVADAMPVSTAGTGVPSNAVPFTYA
eukprot:scaffold536_cov250-Pinguiococcus_pyrenoidosus.AAC.19